MIADIGFVSAIPQIFDPAWVPRAIKNTIAPSGNPAFIGGVISGRIPIVLVGGCESDGGFRKGAEAECRVGVHFMEQLIILK